MRVGEVVLLGDTPLPAGEGPGVRAYPCDKSGQNPDKPGHFYDKTGHSPDKKRQNSHPSTRECHKMSPFWRIFHEMRPVLPPRQDGAGLRIAGGIRPKCDSLGDDAKGIDGEPDPAQASP